MNSTSVGYVNVDGGCCLEIRSVEREARFADDKHYIHYTLYFHSFKLPPGFQNILFNSFVNVPTSSLKNRILRVAFASKSTITFRCWCLLRSPTFSGLETWLITRIKGEPLTSPSPYFSLKQRGS